jgi:hypothetical protein
MKQVSSNLKASSSSFKRRNLSDTMTHSPLSQAIMAYITSELDLEEKKKSLLK